MRRMRLSVRLPLLIVVTAVAVICIIILLSLFLIRNTVRETETEALTNSVNGYASAIDFYLDEARSVIEITAQGKEMTEFRLPPLNAPATEELPADTHVPLHNIATSILQNSQVFEYLMLLNPDGSVYLLEPHELQSQLSRHGLAFTDWYWKFVETKQTVVSDLHISTTTQRPTVVVATPVRSPDGRLIGIWAGGLKLEALSQLGISEPQTGPPERYGYITDSRGLIIAHQGNPKYVQEQTDFSSTPPVQAALTGRQGTMQYISTIDGLEKLAAYMPFPNMHWTVVYLVSTEAAFEPIYQLTRYIGLIGLLAVIAMGLGGLAIARQVTKPLEQLTEGAAAIGAGNLSQRLKVATGDEIGQLAAEFNRMAASLSHKEAQLREYAATLEQKVEERTSELQQSEQRLKEAQALGRIGNWELDLVTQEMEWSDELYELHERDRALGPASAKEHALYFPSEDVRKLIDVARLATEKGEESNYELKAKLPSGKTVFFDAWTRPIKDENGRVIKLFGILQDITERKQAEEEVRKAMAELERSNAELERFAYVASHDLQEPLRMVSSYTQLLEKRYKDKLDDDAHDFINYAVDGAKRMQNLINDLLTYSRVGTRGKPFELIDCEAVLDATLANLDVAISSSKAKVTHDPLPTVMADEGQLVQLFQNLIDNGIKFHGKKPPRVHISAEQKDSEWVFSVKDNGIGIDPQYFDRIFIVFQRLHREEEYKGTGIGLAVALRIVRRHGGRMWIESQPGKGSTFHFIIQATGSRQSAVGGQQPE